MKLIVRLFIIFYCCSTQAQQTNVVDFKRAEIQLTLLPEEKNVSGIAVYYFDILKDTDSIFLDGKDMEFNMVTVNEEKVVFESDNKRVLLLDDFKVSQNNKLVFNFSANPKKALYFIDWDHEDGNKQIWTQGQGKYTSNWLPSIDDMNDKIEFDLQIIFDKDYKVIANGQLKSLEPLVEGELNIWHYDMQNPMSSYLVAIAIGKYDKKVQTSKSGIPLEMYYYPEDSLKFEPTYRYTKQMFDFLEEEIGWPYPWQNYKQVPVKDFLYAGMENTSLTIFSDSYVIDSISFIDKNYVNVNAHELAHQWFGNLVTETSGTHHWLQEGFATYYALLAEKDIFGDDHYYWQLYQYVQELIEQHKAGGSTSLLDPKSSSTTFYRKGALVLHILREQVGDNAFRLAVKNYLEKHQFKNVETNDFISEVEKTSGKNLNEFVESWLQNKDFDSAKALNSLKKSKFIEMYLNVDCSTNPYCENYLTSHVSEEIKIKVISQIAPQLKKDHFNASLKVRQAIAQNVSKISPKSKSYYETLLNDASYVTIETALYNLWNNFPHDRHMYLNKTKHLQGFNDKNIRMLWLTLALVTEDYEAEKKPQLYEELINYTNPNNHFEVRQNAFQYLKLINACNETCQENLEQATKSPVWQFSKMAKDLLNGP